MKPIDPMRFHKWIQGLCLTHGFLPVKTAFTLGGVLLIGSVAGATLLSGCGNAQINWARLISNLENTPSQTSTQQSTPTIIQRKVQTGFGQGIASASGVTARIWIKTGTSQGGFQGAGGGVILKNVTLK